MEKIPAVTPEERIEHIMQAQAEIRAVIADGQSEYASPMFMQVYQENHGLIGHTIMRYYFSALTYVRFDELASIAPKAATRAIVNFDPSKGSFSTTYVQHLRSRLAPESGFYRRLPYVPENARHELMRVQRELEGSGDAPVTNREVQWASPDLDDEHAQWIANAYWAGQDRNLPEYDNPAYEDAPVEMPVQFIDTSQDEYLDRSLDVASTPGVSELHRCLDLLKELNPRAHEVIMRRYMHPVHTAQPTLHEVGVHIGSKKQRVHQLEQEALTLLKNPHKLQELVDKQRVRARKKEALRLRADERQRKVRQIRVVGGEYRGKADKLVKLNLTPEQLEERMALLRHHKPLLAKVIDVRYLGEEGLTKHERVSKIIGAGLTTTKSREKLALALLANPDELTQS